MRVVMPYHYANVGPFIFTTLVLAARPGSRLQPWQQRSHEAVGMPQGDNLMMLSRKPTWPNHEKYHVTVDRARLLMISRCYRATRVAGGNYRSLHCSAATHLNKFLLSEKPLAPKFCFMHCSTGIRLFYHHY
jgi:hypothetical protein